MGELRRYFILHLNIKLILCCFCCLCFETLQLITSSLTLAKSYDWVQIHSSDIQMINTASIEAEFRLRMIQSAKTSLDIVAFDQNLDLELGLPLLKALKEAANRGVKVRYLTAWIGMALRDPFSKTVRFLKNPMPQVPIEYRIVGGMGMWKNGWGPFEGIHEKLFIIDNSLTLVTGRGHTGEYLNWLDTCFAFKGKLSEQAHDAYERLWASSERESIKSRASATRLLQLDQEDSQGIYEEDEDEDSELDSESLGFKIPSDEELRQRILGGGRAFSDIGSQVKSDRLPIHTQAGITGIDDSLDIQELNRLSLWALQPAIYADEKVFGNWTGNSSAEFYSARLLHHDLLDQMREIVDQSKKSQQEYSWDWRIKNLEDPVIEELISLIQKGKDLRYFSLSTHLSPKFKEALVSRLKDGLSLNILTNGKAAHTQIMPLRTPLGWYTGLRDLNDLLGAGATVFGLLWHDTDSPVFLHRKIAVIDDTVIFGSHNFNISSTVESDEMSFEIKGMKLADQVRALFSESVNTVSVQLDPKIIREDFNKTGFQRWISDYFAGFY